MKSKKLHIITFIKLAFKYVPFHSAGLLIINIINGLIPFLQIMITTRLIDSVVHYTDAAYRNISYQCFFMLIALQVYGTLISSASNIIMQRATISMQKTYRYTVIEKCAKLKYQYIENDTAWDLISRMLNWPESVVLNNYTALLHVIEAIISAISIVVVIFTHVWWAALIILSCCPLLFWLAVKSGKAQYKAQKDATLVTRKYEYLSAVLSGRDNVDERNLFNYSDEINDRYVKAFGEAFSTKVRTRWGWFLKTKLGGMFTVLAGVAVILILLQPTLNRTLSIGLYISIITSIFSLTSRLSWGLSGNVDALTQGCEYMREMDEYMKMEEAVNALSPPSYSSEIKNITFENVSFSYPGNDFPVLKNVSFTLEKGKHYAIAGTNGAGKTTIIKLLLGMYSNYEGNIYINEKELREYPSDQLKGMFSVVFQDYCRYSLSFRENIVFGKLSLLENLDDNKAVEKSINAFDLNKAVESLPNKLYTNLGKVHEDGVDLSGGEWQRVAMARAYISPAAVRILDEPTASLDPISENKIYEHFSKLNTGILTILISHRLASTKISDEILVFDEGQLIEQGTFSMLMKMNGLFCSMFEQQRKWYS
ncbi:ABC transporter ATP-binding protein [Clostridia bacterium]|nr:ABC transporter ATP-binding protein [Clostridia bacterium]